MNDLVKRLRDYTFEGDSWQLQQEAAVEIERLEKELSESQAREVKRRATLETGALYDFMGWLTTRPERLTLSSVDDAAPAADAVNDFLTMLAEYNAVCDERDAIDKDNDKAHALLQQALAAIEAALSDDQPYIQQSKDAVVAIKEFLE